MWWTILENAVTKMWWTILEYKENAVTKMWWTILENAVTKIYWNTKKMQ